MGKKALVIGMNFYNYEKAIVQELLFQGFYHVDLFEDVPLDYTKKKRLVTETRLKHLISEHQNNIIKKISNNQYDLILVIVGRFLEKKFLERIRGKCPKAKMILYLWDDVARVENFEEVRNCYDKIYSFDPVDCYQYGFVFLPLFYTPEYKLDRKTKKEYDIYSALSAHSDRVKIVNRICVQHEKSPFLFYINMGRIGYINFQIHNLLAKNQMDKRMRLIPKPIDKETNNQNMASSKAILDIPFKGQVGLTIRTLEALGSGVKLITTNKSVQYYDFYNPQNILIIDNENPFIPDDFVALPYIDVLPEVYHKYSLRHWVDVIVKGYVESYLKEGITFTDIFRNLYDFRKTL